MKLQYLRGTVSLSLDGEKCIGCGMCIAVCPHNVYAIEGKRAGIVDRDSCMECGACRSNRPAAAIEVESGTGGVMPVIEEMRRKAKAPAT